MFFKHPNPDISPQELQRVVRNLQTQRELIERQLKDGSISQQNAQDEMKRLSTLISAYNNNTLSALDAQQPNYTPQ